MEVVHFPVIFEYHDIKQLNTKLLEKQLKYTFGPESAGLCLVRNIPDYEQARLDLLKMIDELANLDEKYLKELELPESFFSKGFIRPKSQYNDKGYFSAQESTFTASLIYDGQKTINNSNSNNNSSNLGQVGKLINDPSNVWPNKYIPGFQEKFINLSNIIKDVGYALSEHLDNYAYNLLGKDYQQNTLKHILELGEHTGTCYHYYPDQKQNEQDSSITDTWGNWHNDFCALTAVVPELYTNKGKKVKIIDQTAGFFYKNTQGEIAKLQPPTNSIVFLIGEAMQILSGGLFQASPHAVMKCNQKTEYKELGRNSFAFHFEPQRSHQLLLPTNYNTQKATQYKEGIPPLDKRWFNGMKYGDFHYNSLHSYFNQEILQEQQQRQLQQTK